MALLLTGSGLIFPTGLTLSLFWVVDLLSDLSWQVHHKGVSWSLYYPQCTLHLLEMAPDRSPTWVWKKLLLPNLKLFHLGVYETASIYVFVSTAWIGRRDLPSQGLSCCLVKHLNVSGSEVHTGSTCIKLTGATRCRVPRGKWGRFGHSRFGIFCCLQRFCVCTGRIFHQRIVRYWNMCK